MMEGRILGGRYELLQVVGQGGMGIVYKARCKILDRIVAVKVLKEEFVDNASFVEKFRTEAMAAARIAHPNIVNVYDVGQDNGTYYIVMEFVEGQTLKEYIAEQGGLSLNTAISLAVMICVGVQHAHANQVIHRDLKPQNILVTKEGNVKVADFGIARANTTATITFNKDQVMGSVHYISPEQARGAGVNYATDIYSLGCILYEMCTGRLPFDAESPVTVALKHLHDEPIPPADLNPAISAELEDTILHAMMKLPARRFGSVEEMRQELIQMVPDLKQNYPASEVKSEPVPSSISPETIVTGTKSANDQIDQKYMEKYYGEYQQPKKKIRPVAKIIIAVAFLAFLAGIGFEFVTKYFGQEIVVPSLVGKTLTEAEKLIEDAGLTLNVVARQPDTQYGADFIVEQEPAAESMVKKGREVKIIVSSGFEEGVVPVVLEDLQGKSLTEAEAYLTSVGLKVGTVDKVFDQKYALDTVISQTPVAQESVAPGTEVSLMVSKGPEAEKVKVPDCTGMTKDQAQTRLIEAGLALGEVTYQNTSNTAETDKVVDQGIQPNTMMSKGTEIGIVLGKYVAPQTQTQTQTPATPAPQPQPEPAPTPQPEVPPAPVVQEPAQPETPPAQQDVLLSKALQIQIPTGHDSYSVSVEITDTRGTRTVYHQNLQGGIDITLNINYYNAGSYQVYLDGELATSGTL